jgi:lipid II:glycine glycyltransferase (peptidoglycan interpeptide bridge formation enzyme)
VVLDLPPVPDAAGTLWKRLDAKVRSQVRRPQKEGVTVRFGFDQVEPFFAVFSRHMRDLGTPTQPRRLFEAISAVFPDDVWFGCAYLNGAAVAAGCGFRWGTEFEMTWASSLSTYKRLAPNMLLYWAFMERAANEGLRTFNFGRCTTGSGTHRFKQQWGTRDEQLWWYMLSPRRLMSRRLGKTPSPDDGAYAWGPRVWRKLPLPLANALGPQIVRYIP